MDTHEHGWTRTRDEGLYAIKCTWSESNLPLTKEHFSRPCLISGQWFVWLVWACAASRLRGRPCLCAGSQLVRQLSGSDLWPLDSNLSSLPAQYCYNWQLMRPDMLSSRALNRTSIFPRHKYHFCSLSHITVLSPLLPCSLSPRVGPSDRLWKGLCILMEMFLIRQRRLSHMLAF